MCWLSSYVEVPYSADSRGPPEQLVSGDLGIEIDAHTRNLCEKGDIALRMTVTFEGAACGSIGARQQIRTYGHNRTVAYSGQRTFKWLLHSETHRMANSYSSALAAVRCVSSD